MGEWPIVHWERYEVCPTCHAKTGEKCRDGRYLAWRAAKKPHPARPHKPPRVVRTPGGWRHRPANYDGRTLQRIDPAA